MKLTAAGTVSDSHRIPILKSLLRRGEADTTITANVNYLNE